MIPSSIPTRRKGAGVVGAAALLAALGACAGSAQLPGFGEGTRWAIPILGALGDDIPIAPVTIDGKGPYLFAVDVNAGSAIDPRLARDLGLKPAEGKGEGAGPAPVTVPRITLGSLTVTAARFQVRNVRATYHGRPVQGSIGREILHPALLWTMDRDRQVVHLARPEHQAPPAGADRVPVRAGPESQGGALVVEAEVGEGVAATVRVVLGEPSMIRPALAEQAGMRSIGEGAWMADEIRVGESSVYEVLFSALAPEGEAAAGQSEAGGTPGAGQAHAGDGAGAGAGAASGPGAATIIDGVLGARFWARFAITVLLRDQAMWLQPRADDIAALTGERLARWGPFFDGCDSAPACVTLAVTAPVPAEAPAAAAPEGNRKSKAGKGKGSKRKGKGKGKAGSDDTEAGEGAADEAGPGTGRLVVTRDPSKQDVAYDVLLQALDEVDTPLPAPYLLVALPRGVTEAAFDLSAIAAAYERATSFRVVDATPFPPPCQSKQGCVWLHR